MRKKHILVISQYFYPEQFRINEICEEWINRGYKVTVLTGIPNYPKGRFYKGYGLFSKRKESYKGINIFRIPIFPRFKGSLFLALNYISFVISGLVWSIFTRLKSDIVFIFEVSPMTQALPGIWYSKKLKIPCFIYVQDLWPENFEVISGISNKYILQIINVMVDYIYKNCNKIFVSSRSFLTNILNRNINEEKLFYWPQYAENVDNTEISGKFIETHPNEFKFIYTGNIGTAQGFSTLLYAIFLYDQKFKNDNVYNIKFYFVGDGRNKENVLNEICELNIQKYFSFIPQKPVEDIPQIIKNCDVCFLSLSDSKIFSMTIPAKLQTYMNCEMPILAVAKGEVPQIIEDAKCGYSVNPGDSQKLLETIIKFCQLKESDLDVMGKNSKEYSSRNFNKNILMNEMDDLLNQYIDIK